MPQNKQIGIGNTVPKRADLLLPEPVWHNIGLVLLKLFGQLRSSADSDNLESRAHGETVARSPESRLKQWI